MSKKIRDIMTRNVEIVRPDETLQEAAMKMRSRDVGFLPVCDGQRLVGALSDRDIAIGSVAEGKDPKKMKVRDLASSTVCWCYDDQDVDDAASMMTDKGSVALWSSSATVNSWWVLFRWVIWPPNRRAGYPAASWRRWDRSKGPHPPTIYA